MSNPVQMSIEFNEKAGVLSHACFYALKVVNTIYEANG